MPTIGAAEKQAKRKQTAAAKQAKAAAMRKKAAKKPAGPTIAQLKAQIRSHNKACPVLKLSGTKATLSHRLAAVGQRQAAPAAAAAPKKHKKHKKKKKGGGAFGGGGGTDGQQTEAARLRAMEERIRAAGGADEAPGLAF
jgi:hypothetical protein